MSNSTFIFDLLPRNVFVFLILLFFAPGIINIFRVFLTSIPYQKVRNNLQEGLLPEEIENFPMHETSQEEYQEVKAKVDSFRKLLLENDFTELVLNQGELNDLVLKGEQICKYAKGIYSYYEIQENRIIEYLIEGPSYLPPNPYFTRTKEIYFFTSRGKPQQYHKIIKENGRNINYQISPYSLDKSSLIFCILGISPSPDRFPFKFRRSLEFEKGLDFVNKVRSVQVLNGTLVIKA